MFTGIVQGIATIDDVIQAPGLNTLIVSFPEGRVQGVETGASVALNGTCLTVTRQEGSQLHFDAMQETLKTTTLGELSAGDARHNARRIVVVTCAAWLLRVA